MFSIITTFNVHAYRLIIYGVGHRIYVIAFRVDDKVFKSKLRGLFTLMGYAQCVISFRV
jgi:hypothetical protein